MTEPNFLEKLSLGKMRKKGQKWPQITFLDFFGNLVISIGWKWPKMKELERNTMMVLMMTDLPVDMPELIVYIFSFTILRGSIEMY